MKNLLIIGLLFITTGCGNFFIRDENLPVIVTETETEYLIPEVNIDAYLLEECDSLKELPYEATFADILVVTKENSIIYHDCKQKHHDLSILLRKSLNLGESK